MPDTNDNDIDALLDALVPIASGFGDCDICKTDALRCHAALTALVAERDALRKECNNRFDVAKIKELVAERDALQSKIDSMNEAMHSIARRQVALEEEAEERQSIGLRERLVCAIWPEILRQWHEYKDAIDPRGAARSDALVEADKMLAAMRKGDTNGK